VNKPTHDSNDQTPFDKFKDLTKNLIRVPKKEVDAKAKKKAKRAKKKPAKK